MDQRSLVLLTHLPFPRLFTDALLICKPLFLRYGVDMFESACHNISNWLVFHTHSTISSCFKLGHRQRETRLWSWDCWAQYCIQSYLGVWMNNRWLKRRHLERPITLSFMWALHAVRILALTRFPATRISSPCRPSGSVTLCRPSTVTLVSVGVFDSFRTNTSVLAFSGSHQCSCVVVTRLIAAGKIRVFTFQITPSVRHRYHFRATSDLISPCTTLRNKH
jgi:hypothetical protein